MAKVQITGMREYSFKDQKTGRTVEGLSIYILNPLKDSDDGLRADGFTCDKISVKKGTDLYQRMLAAEYVEPFPAEVIYDLMPGNKRPVLNDILF